jgi:hypothetical protein
MLLGAHHPGARGQRPPRNFVDYAVGFRIISSRIGDATITVADEAGNNRIEVDQELLYRACRCLCAA